MSYGRTMLLFLRVALTQILNDIERYFQTDPILDIILSYFYFLIEKKQRYNYMWYFSVTSLNMK